MRCKMSFPCHKRPQWTPQECVGVAHLDCLLRDRNADSQTEDRISFKLKQKDPPINRTKSSAPHQNASCHLSYNSCWHRRHFHHIKETIASTMSEESGGLVEETNLGLMIAVPLFLLINASLAYVGGRLMSKMEHKSSEDVLTAHYLGGRSFGPVLSMGTMVRTVQILCTIWSWFEWL